MYTPQEVSEKTFPKSTGLTSGYNMTAVDEFLDGLTEDYTALYKDNTTLKAKLKMLAEKVEEYRATEDANAIAEHLAQKRTVILNMENTDSETSRRLLDFATGVVFSCDGKLRRVASKTYIVAPGLVDLSGELVDGMDGGGLYM